MNLIPITTNYSYTVCNIWDQIASADITGGNESDALDKDDDGESQPGKEEGVLVGLPLPQLLLRGPLPNDAPDRGHCLLLLLEDGRASCRPAADYGRRRLQHLGVLDLAAALPSPSQARRTEHGGDGGPAAAAASPSRCGSRTSVAGPAGAAHGGDGGLPLP